MGKDTSQIRDEIEQTRARMGDTVEAIGYKADVPARVRDNVNDRIESVKGTIGAAVTGTKRKASSQARGLSGKAHDLSDAASESLDDARGRVGDAADSTKRAVSLAMENPLGLALGALALGFIGGLLIPVSDIERENIGPVRDEIASRAQTAVHEAVDAGKAILTDAVAGATDAAQKHGAEIAQHAVAGTPLEQHADAQAGAQEEPAAV